MAKTNRKGTTSLGIDENIEALLTYLLGWVTGIIFWIIEKKNKFVRFHAIQSTVTFLALTILGFAFTLIPFIGFFLGILIDIVSFILWVLLMFKAYHGEKYKLPIVGNFAEKNA